jgi:lysozyme family protein
MVDLAVLRTQNAKRWAAAKPTRNFASVAKHLVAPEAKVHYKAVNSRTGVPWWFIAVVHEREASQSWMGSLAQGDPWNKVSVHVPAGRGPFHSWEEAAVDALVNCQPHAARNKDWSIGAAFTLLEEYNGLGYAMRGRPSPYVWSGTNQYVSGKFIRDGVYSPDTVDAQLGCAGLLLAMMALDPSIDLGHAAPVTGPVSLPPVTVIIPPAPTRPAPPSITNPAKGSIGAFIAGIFAKLFGRK